MLTAGTIVTPISDHQSSQLVFGIAVLGLSVTLAKHQVIGSPPTETSFSSFVGAFGIIVSVLGLASLWIDRIPVFVVMSADALLSIFYLAGGIALAIALKGVGSCTDNSSVSIAQRFTNSILNGGCTDHGCYVGGGDGDYSQLTSRCQRAQADYVIEFIGFVVALIGLALAWLVHKQGGGSSRSYV
ncbi:marvel domain-containing protein [Truncatella angustata]|uniref:Marvel domain-containing protein n=1 Tax=Truncatella angustata TaxID=152316 RepID=A0A9P8ULG7_9PEZI|nr:marvel domain-containing protein [Truncatella angustata]KAH6654157.1 marvel domain-containing protein [Truncatella angustata]